VQSLTVTKCHGTGNDFVLLDARGLGNIPYPDLARELCRRRTSLGADGMLVLEPASHSANAVAMRIFNADGSEAESCGNGLRCVARYLHEQDTRNDTFDIETASGAVRAQIVSFRGAPGVRVCLGAPSVSRDDSGRTVNGSLVREISMGNPHTVVFVSAGLEAIDLDKLADQLTQGQPESTNLEVAIIASNEISMRVRERGVGETWACGTGACAVAAAAIEAGRATSPVTIRSKGGVVTVEWSGPRSPAYLTGDAQLVYRTTIPMPVSRASIS